MAAVEETPACVADRAVSHDFYVWLIEGRGQQSPASWCEAGCIEASAEQLGAPRHSREQRHRSAQRGQQASVRHDHVSVGWGGRGGGTAGLRRSSYGTVSCSSMRAVGAEGSG